MLTCYCQSYSCMYIHVLSFLWDIQEAVMNLQYTAGYQRSLRSAVPIPCAPVLCPWFSRGSLPRHFFLHQRAFLCSSYKQAPSWNTHPLEPVIPLICFNFLHTTWNLTVLMFVCLFFLLISLWISNASLRKVLHWLVCFEMAQTKMIQDFQFLLSPLPLGASSTNFLSKHSPPHIFFPDLVTHFMKKQNKNTMDTMGFLNPRLPGHMLVLL